MGHEIVYCITCGARLTTSDFEKEKAFRVEEMYYCQKCAPPKIPGSKPAVLPKPPTRRPAGATLSKDTGRATTRASAPLPSRSRKSAALFGLIGGGIFVIVIVLVFAMGSGNPGKPPPSPTPPKGGTAKVKPPPPKVGPLERARAYRRDHPDDLIGQLREYEKAAWQLPPSRVKECQTELNGIKADLQKKLDAELAELEKKITGPIGEKNFEEAEEILQEALARYDTPMWSLGVGKKIGRVKDLRYEAGLAMPEPEPPAPEPKPPTPPEPEPPPPPLPSSLKEGLLGWWTFEEGSGDTTADASGNGHDATLKNSVTREKKDNMNCLCFSGKKQFLEIPHAPGLNVGTKSFSVCFRIYPNNSYPRRVVCKRQDQSGWDIDINSNGTEKDSGKLLVTLYDGETHQWCLKAKISKKQWQHVAVTIDRKKNELKVYVDGSKKDKTQDLSAVKGSLDSDAPLFVGYDPGKKTRSAYLAAYLSDFRLYDRVLSSSEVKAFAR